jgi:hypothetical protein
MNQGAQCTPANLSGNRFNNRAKKLSKIDQSMLKLQDNMGVLNVINRMPMSDRFSISLARKDQFLHMYA